VLFSGCVTYEKCQDKYGSKVDTVYFEIEREVPVQVIAPADSTQIAIDADTIVPGKVYETKSDSSEIKLKYWKDNYTRLLYVSANIPKRIIRDTLIIRDTIPCIEVNNFEPTPEKKSIWDKVATWLLCVTVLILIIKVKSN
jgi:hypothetical protein